MAVFSHFTRNKLIMKVGDLVKDCDGFLGIVMEIHDACDLYEQLLCAEIFEDDEDGDLPMGYKFVSVYCFQEKLEMVFLDTELEVME